MEDYIDTSMAEKTVWLMKCPAVVSRSLQSSSIPNNLPVAKVVVSIDPLSSNTNDTTQFTMELSGTDLGNVPRCFSMEMSKDFIPMSVFSESQGSTETEKEIAKMETLGNAKSQEEETQGSSSKRKICVEGKILNKFDMRPHYDAIESYGKLCRERTDKYMTKTRQIQMIGNDRPMVPMPGITHVQEKKKMVVKGSETKRTRRDRGEMEEIMFKLFEHQPNWTLKELIQKTDQPEQFMKDLLKDLCVYNNKGANQGSYELKPEYKRSVFL